jgi:hypothetical protein
MKPRKEIEEQLARNSCMTANSPDTIMISDAIRTLARIMLDIRELLEQIEEWRRAEKREQALRR